MHPGRGIHQHSDLKIRHLILRANTGGLRRICNLGYNSNEFLLGIGIDFNAGGIANADQHEHTGSANGDQHEHADQDPSNVFRGQVHEGALEAGLWPRAARTARVQIIARSRR